jgi:hypothetical protein
MAQGLAVGNLPQQKTPHCLIYRGDLVFSHQCGQFSEVMSLNDSLASVSLSALLTLETVTNEN